MIDPLVPPYVDLREFDDMPLSVKRLRDSKFTATVKAEEFRSGVLLWCSAWHQVPAGSLPDDDTQLAQLAGYGYGVKEWKKVKAGALYGWQQATDGRLYHETAAEKALESWGRMVDHAYRKHADRWRKENAKRKERKEEPLLICTPIHWKEVTCANGIPPESAIDSAGIPLENTTKGKEGKGKEGSYLKPRGATHPVGQEPDDARREPEKPKVNGHDQKPERTQQLKSDAREIIGFLNAKAGKNFPETDSNVGIVVARFREGFTPLQVRQVIAMKVREWKADPDMAKYLRPETLFGRTKFSGYVGELVPVEDGDAS